MTAFYNEIDPYAAQWLRNLIKEGHIANGIVDERSIEDIKPDELSGFTQCHFFAGIGVWSLALRNAGWPDSKPVWTGSCPCQPFSSAGKGVGFDDERHLWPAFNHLIEQCRPAIVFGEQVASKDADAWIDLVCADMEALDYSFGAVPFPSASVGAPHIRDRLYWVADAANTSGEQRCEFHMQRGRQDNAEQNWMGSIACGLADSDNAGLEGRGAMRQRTDQCAAGPYSVAERLDYAIGIGRGARRHDDAKHDGKQLDANGQPDRAGPTNGHWRNADWLHCRDGKWRPVSPLPQPLVDGSSESLGRVRSEIIAEVEEEINASTAQTEGGRTTAMRALLQYLGAEAKRCWPSGGVPGLHESPFLLAFLRQLQEQGWHIAQGVSLPCPQTTHGNLRGLRSIETAGSTPCERSLDGQQTREPANVVRVLSCLLARHASAAWGDAYAVHAETGFPLAHGARSRVGRLRAYGNAINAIQAQIFIESVMP